MITFFAIPKPFRGHIEVIQKNARASWARIEPACEILLMGDDFKVRETAQEFGARWLPEIKRTSLGTPLVSSAFQLAASQAVHDWICYVNADIILPEDFTKLVGAVRSPRTIFVGQHWDLNITERLDFKAPGAGERLRDEARAHGKLHIPEGIDYFLLRKDSLLTELPPFAVGRPAWDNWLIYRARQLGYVVVDATGSVLAIHQEHDYSHVPGGTGAGWDGPETVANRAMLGSLERHFTVLYATHLLRNGNLQRALSRKYLWNRVRAFPVLHPVAGWPLAAGRTVWRAAKRLLGLKGGCL